MMMYYPTQYKLLTFLLYLFTILFLCMGTLARADDDELFDVDEKEYLQNAAELSLCVDPNWLPYEKLTTDGQYIGLVAEYMALYETKLGIKFNILKTNTWTETEDLYRQGKCDVVSAINQSTTRDDYLYFTEPYISSPAVLVINDAITDVKSLSELSGKTLAMVDGHVYQSLIERDYPEINLVTVSSMEVALDNISKQSADASIGPLFLSAALIQKGHLNNLKMVGNTEYKDELRVGVDKNKPILKTIFDKLITSITVEEHADTKKRWLSKALSR